ncbi:MAG: M1 family aminopeptidase [Gemmataceae bacterium]
MLKRLEILGVVLVLLVLHTWCAPARGDARAELPRYDLDIQLDVDGHHVAVRERVTWTNCYARPTDELVFNAHARFVLPDEDIGLSAKMLEILRMMPRDVFDFNGPPLNVDKVRLIGIAHDWRPPVPRVHPPAAPPPANGGDELLPPPRVAPDVRKPIADLAFDYRADMPTALVVKLPRPVAKGETVTIDIEFWVRLPQKQGRWGQWEGVTYLATWLPVLAVYGETGWDPVPFIPWHQPFYNEAGNYHANLTLPVDQKLASSGSVVAETDLGDGRRRLEIDAPGVREFSMVCSARFCEWTEVVPPSTPHGKPVRVKVLAFPEHEFYARHFLACACYALPIYSRWFGAYPYPEFTVVESFFGWNGNECSGMVMIDERCFAFPHIGAAYMDQLITHELCHQWWYNVVGTNGYAETWMDEGLATYFSHKVSTMKHGKEAMLIEYPRGLKWMPNIRREDYRTYGMYGTIARGDHCPIVQPMPGFKHLVNLFSMTYDKGSRVVGMIEERMGEAAFLDFMKHIYRKYQYRILRVADFQRELEEYTGRSWEDFFQNWLYGVGLADWAIKKVKIEDLKHDSKGWKKRWRCWRYLPRLHHSKEPCRVEVLLKQKGEFCEPTVLGVCLGKDEEYAIRVPILPNMPVLDMPDYGTRVECLDDQTVRVIMELPCEPTQIVVDPDGKLLDKHPTNNAWKPRVRYRFSPIMTFLDENDLTTMYDRWNVTCGPWFYSPTYENPWYTRATRLGLRASAYRMQSFVGGLYAAYRTDYRDVVIGADGFWDHFPFARTQVGFNVERRVLETDGGDSDASQAVVYGRYVIDYGTSLYLPPFQYVEAFGSFQDNMLPFARDTVPGSVRYKHQNLAGLHYHKNYLTPYWDAEGGYQFDLSYAAGNTDLFGGSDLGSHEVSTQLSYVKTLPGWTGDWLSTTRLATRGFFAAGFPNRVQFFPLGGGEGLRGYDLSQKQGSLLWIASLEWRVPLWTHLNIDCCDHIVGLRGVYAVPFYDVGQAYLRDEPIGQVAHSLGGGLRLDLAWFGLIERTIVRLDAAKVINDNTPWQFWLGLKHPF